MKLRQGVVLLAAAAACGLASGYVAPGSAELRRFRRRSAFFSPPSLLSATATPSRLDELILEMRATTTQQLGRLVAENIKLIDTSFFLRLAELSDATDDRLEKARLSQLADTVARTLQSAVEQTDRLADSKALQAQQIIATLADDDGEFVTPVPPHKLALLRERLRAELPSLDENFVTTLRAFLKKCNDDNLDGMVVVLQKVLQTFASERLLAMSRGLRPDLRDTVSSLLLADADDWSAVLATQLQAGAISADDISQVLKEEVAQVVLELPSGSLTQAVVAEYLGEAIKRVDEAAAAMPSSE
jgi:hypothetical protein